MGSAVLRDCCACVVPVARLPALHAADGRLIYQACAQFNRESDAPAWNQPPQRFREQGKPSTPDFWHIASTPHNIAGFSRRCSTDLSTSFPFGKGAEQMNLVRCLIMMKSYTLRISTRV